MIYLLCFIWFKLDFLFSGIFGGGGLIGTIATLMYNRWVHSQMEARVQEQSSSASENVRVRVAADNRSEEIFVAKTKSGGSVVLPFIE